MDVSFEDVGVFSFGSDHHRPPALERSGLPSFGFTLFSSPQTAADATLPSVNSTEVKDAALPKSAARTSTDWVVTSVVSTLLHALVNEPMGVMVSADSLGRAGAASVSAGARAAIGSVPSDDWSAVHRIHGAVDVGMLDLPVLRGYE